MAKMEILEISEDSNISPSEIKSKYRANQLKYWFFTWNNYPDDGIMELEKTFQKICTKYVFQEEKGKSGTPHLQGSIELKKKMRWSEFGLPKQISWSKTRNIDKANAYCQKLDSRNGKIYKYGFPAELEVIVDLYPWQKFIYDMCLNKPDKRSIVWIYDKKGMNGKTELCKYLHKNINALSATSGSAKDIACMLAMAVKNGRDLNQLTTFIFHYSRTSEKISYKAIESVKDGYITSTKYESGTLVFNNPHVFVFSNEKPDIDKLTKDRWKIFKIVEKILIPIPLDKLALE